MAIWWFLVKLGGGEKQHCVQALGSCISNYQQCSIMAEIPGKFSKLFPNHSILVQPCTSQKRGHPISKWGWILSIFYQFLVKIFNMMQCWRLFPFWQCAHMPTEWIPATLQNFHPNLKCWLSLFQYQAWNISKLPKLACRKKVTPLFKSISTLGLCGRDRSSRKSSPLVVAKAVPRN